MNLKRRKRIIIRLIISAVMLTGLGIAYLVFRLMPHRLMKNIEEELRGFTAEQTQEIFDAYDITVPENEKNVSIYCFSRSDRGHGAEHMYVWCLEIAGVRDYDAFFAANSGRVLEKSSNETSEAAKDGLNYYITYIAENFSVYYSEHKEITDNIGDVYEKMRTTKGLK